MTTLGYTTTPTAGTFSAVGSTSQVGIQITMPSNGVITTLHAYFRLQSGSGTAWLCLWNSSGTLLESVAVSAVSGFEQWYSAALATPYVASNGNVFFVGFAVPTADGFTVEHDSTGTAYEGTQASPPGNCTFTSSGFGTIGAYVDYFQAIFHVYRSGAWTSGPVDVYRSGAWSVGQEVEVERSSTWTVAT